MLKTQKGITLIALIITIIVMLILVGVTITVSLNGGLFEKAKQAGDEYQAAAERDKNVFNEIYSQYQNGGSGSGGGSGEGEGSDPESGTQEVGVWTQNKTQITRINADGTTDTLNVGDTVKRGQTILILEAMKMENNINADKDGKITAINVKTGESVLEGTDLVVIE